MTPTNTRSITISDTIPDIMSTYSPGLAEETLLLSQKEPSIATNRGRRSTIYVAAESKASSRRETTSPARLAYRMRSYSTSSSIANEHGMTTSSSLRDIQVRAASSTKHRRRTQTISIPAQAIRPDTASPRKPLSGVTISVSQKSLDVDGNPKRRAVYTDSMHLDDSAPTLTALCIDLEKHSESPALSCVSAMSQAGDVQSFTPWRPSQVPVNSLKGLNIKKRNTRKRTPLASLDLNIYRNSEHASFSNHTPMATPPSFFSAISGQPTSFLSTDPFAATGLSGYRPAVAPPVYHPIVVDLMAMLDAAVEEWRGAF